MNLSSKATFKADLSKTTRNEWQLLSLCRDIYQFKMMYQSKLLKYSYEKQKYMPA